MEQAHSSSPLLSYWFCSGICDTVSFQLKNCGNHLVLMCEHTVIFALDYFTHTSVRGAVGDLAGVPARGEPYLLKDICSACLHKEYPGAGGLI